MAGRNTAGRQACLPDGPHDPTHKHKAVAGRCMAWLAEAVFKRACDRPSVWLPRKVASCLPFINYVLDVLFAETDQNSHDPLSLCFGLLHVDSMARSRAELSLLGQGDAGHCPTRKLSDKTQPNDTRICWRTSVSDKFRPSGSSTRTVDFVLAYGSMFDGRTLILSVLGRNHIFKSITAGCHRRLLCSMATTGPRKWPLHPWIGLYEQSDAENLVEKRRKLAKYQRHLPECHSRWEALAQSQLSSRLAWKWSKKWDD